MSYTHSCKILPRLFLAAAVLFLAARPADAQTTTGTQQPPPKPAGKGTDDRTIAAGEAYEPARQLVKWNEYRGPHYTFRLGGGFLYEGATYVQDEGSQQQFDLASKWKVRDWRFTFKGGFPSLKRKITYSMGLMYDGPTGEFLVRETGLMIAVPEMRGHLFVGRTKEGFSLNKVMVGYAGWTMERATMSDASIPILADGIKWLGYSTNHRWIWNIGFYGDWLSKKQTFSTYHRQFVTRVAWLPIHSEETGTLLHVGGNFRWGRPEDDTLQAKSRPEAFLADNFIDTGKLPAVATKMAGYEVYLRKGSVILGSEYWFNQLDTRKDSDPAQPGDNPRYHGGDVAMTWLVTGETRGYNTVGGFFKGVSPARPVFQGGPGAWEVVLRFSTTDLDDKGAQGGKFWRFTPMVNWHLSDNMRLEMAYGYGRLNRFGLLGNTHFFQTRLQLQL
jgi:phosphate-selective porin OprO/OprP